MPPDDSGTESYYVDLLAGVCVDIVGLNQVNILYKLQYKLNSFYVQPAINLHSFLQSLFLFFLRAQQIIQDYQRGVVSLHHGPGQALWYHN